MITIGGRRWTEEDYNYIRDKWGSIQIERIAKHLHRSLRVVRNKAAEMGLGSYIENTGKMSLCTLITAISGSKNNYTHVKNCFLRHGLPIKEKRVVKQIVRVVDLNEFWEWAEENKRYLNFRNFEENLLGEEPEWVKEKRKFDCQDIGKKTSSKKWTPNEIEQLKFMMKSGRYTYDDIAKELGRSYLAVSRKAAELNLKKYYKTKKNSRKKFTKEEIDSVMDLYNNKKLNNCIIAQKLNMSQMRCKNIIDYNKKKVEV